LNWTNLNQVDDSQSKDVASFLIDDAKKQNILESAHGKRLLTGDTIVAIVAGRYVRRATFFSISFLHGFETYERTAIL